MRLVLVLGLVSACTIETGNVEAEIVLTRDDGTRIEMPSNTETHAYCEPYDPPYHEEPAIKVFHQSRLGGARWYVWAVRADVSAGETVTFPVAFSIDEPARGALWFVADDKDDNEAASDQPGSTGTLSFQSVDCAGFVELSVDAVIGSEYSDGGAIRVRGSLRAPVGAPPS